MDALGQGDDWDDSILMEIYYDSLKTHQTKKEKKNKNKNNKKQISTDSNENPAKRVKFSNDDLSKSAESNTAPIEGGIKSLIANYYASKNKVSTAQPVSNEGSSTAAVDSALQDTTTAHSNTTGTEDYQYAENYQANYPTDQASIDAWNAYYAATAANGQIAAAPTQIISPPSSSGSNTVTEKSNHQQVTIPSHMLDDALQSMISAVYQSGYATGRYQLLLELSKNQTNKDIPSTTAISNSEGITNEHSQSSAVNTALNHSDILSAQH